MRAEFTNVKVDIEGLTVVSNPFDIRKDLIEYTRYVRNTTIKRAHRTNNIPKKDYLKLAKLISARETVEREISENGNSVWLDSLDLFALKMRFVSYDIEGSYIGYTSREPSFPDNYIEFNEKIYSKYLSSTILEQENRILKILVADCSYSSNEFFDAPFLARLDRFSTNGCACGVVPTLSFKKIRLFLLEMLGLCEPGVWISTEAFIRFLQEKHPWFLIPEKFKTANRYDRKARYGNFSECDVGKWNAVSVDEKDEDAFMRVEGRFVERFLEGVPLTMGYVSVAYDEEKKQKKTPSCSVIKAFMVKERFIQVKSCVISEPKITLQPNFEIHIESDFYPTTVLHTLAPFTRTVKEDRVIILRLDKGLVAEELACSPKTDLPELLRELTGRDIPHNVEIELEEWADHSEKFVLYENAGLFEGTGTLASLSSFVEADVSPQIKVVRDPAGLYNSLVAEHHCPFKVTHDSTSFSTVPEDVKSLFAVKKTRKKRGKTKEKVTLKRESLSSLYFPNKDIFRIFRKALASKGCPFESDEKKMSILFSDRFNKLFKEVVKSLEDYEINTESIT